MDSQVEWAERTSELAARVPRREPKPNLQMWAPTRFGICLAAAHPHSPQQTTTMVLDAHAHLTRQGWKGKGHAVREGHLSRPLAVKVKNNLNGLGKDRDDAFPCALLPSLPPS